jgi:hypothetical protein
MRKGKGATAYLCERLGEDDGKSLFDKVSWGVSVTVYITGSETLVGHVEESEVLLFLLHYAGKRRIEYPSRDGTA